MALDFFRQGIFLEVSKGSEEVCGGPQEQSYDDSPQKLFPLSHRRLAEEIAQHGVVDDGGLDGLREHVVFFMVVDLAALRNVFLDLRG